VVQFLPGQHFDDADVEKVELVGAEDSHYSQVVFENHSFLSSHIFVDRPFGLEAHNQFGNHLSMVVENFLELSSLDSHLAEGLLAHSQKHLGQIDHLDCIFKLAVDHVLEEGIEEVNNLLVAALKGVFYLFQRQSQQLAVQDVAHGARGRCEQVEGLLRGRQVVMGCQVLYGQNEIVALDVLLEVLRSIRVNQVLKDLIFLLASQSAYFIGIVLLNEL
jgi:uncharacterized protein YaaW (UPF0174 family)